MEINRQYIGARYVPKFFENPDGTHDWLEGVSYEPLTVVTLAGNSFTSKKPVPSTVGSPNLNQEYWAQTGNYNAQVEEYRKDVVKVTKDVEEVKTNLGKTDAKVTELESGLGTTNNNVTALTGRVTELEKDRNGLLIVSDSYGETLNNNFVKQIKASGLFTPTYAITKGGCGFSSGDKHFIELMNEISNSINDKDMIGTVLVAGGYNDYNTDETTIINDINNFIKRANQLFPNAKVKIAFIGWGKQTTHWNGLTKACSAYTKCGLYGGEYITGSEYILHDYSFYDNAGDFHPNQAGQDALTKYLISGIKNGSCDVTYPYKTLDLTMKPGVELENKRGIATVLSNSCVSLRTVKLNFSFPDGVTITTNGRNAISLCEFRNGYIYGDNNSLCSCICSAIYHDKNVNKFRSITGSLTFANGVLSFIPIDETDNGQNYRTPNITQIQILSVNHLFGTMVS